MISNPITGATYFIKGLSLINKNGIRRYVLIPLLINIFIFSIGLWFAIAQFEIFIDWALSPNYYFVTHTSRSTHRGGSTDSVQL